MKHPSKSRIRYVVPGLIVYFALLCLLVASERAATDAQITTLPGALWYSLVTLTTVGYGDLTPVTPVGRIVGAVFMLLSTGLLALLVGMLLAALTGRALPRLRLWTRRHDRWYVFSSDSDASRALASGLKDGLIIFCGKKARFEENALALDISPEALFQMRCAAGGERCLFAMDDDLSANERLAAVLQDHPLQIYCRSDGPDEALPPNVVNFGDNACAARLYWQSQPWKPTGERVALIGNGVFAHALLAQGLLTAPPGCEFDLFGDWSLWRDIHWALAEVPDPQFRLNFHSESWRACAEVLKDLDRVVLCADDPGENREAFSQFKRYYVLRGALHARCPGGLRQAWCFGDTESLFTPELVMKQALNARARQLHALYRGSVDYPVPDWDALPEFMKRSNLAAADHLLTKLRLLLPEADVREITPDACRRAAERYERADADLLDRCRAIEHARWCLFHALYNWRYAPVRNNAERRHPMLIPYARLSEDERRKDDNAWLLLRQLAEEETKV